jgi:hypothetical protein
MKSNPLISAQTTSTPDVTDLVNLIKVPLRHFQTPAYIMAPPEIEVQATDSTELFTQVASLNSNLREGLISEGQKI